MSHLENIARIKIVFDSLEDLSQRVVFVGGATVSLYADRPVLDMRSTDDIDILVELLDYAGYAAIEEQLRGKGFKNDIHSRVICRYIVRGIVVDVMPTSEEILGFSNMWYPLGYSTAIIRDIDENYNIRIFRPEYFLASKLAAFKNRGRGDGRMSSDFEDIVFLLNHRTTIWSEIQAADFDVKTYLLSNFKDLLKQRYVNEWIGSHIDYPQQGRAKYIVDNLVELTNNN